MSIDVPVVGVDAVHDVTSEHPCRDGPITAGDFLRGRIDGTISLDDVRSS